MKYLVSMLGFGLLLVFVSSLAESSLRSSLTNFGANATNDVDDAGNGLQKNASCLILCNYCGCDGSFVGDDCVCDCGIDGEEHVKCLEKLDSIEEQVDLEMVDEEESESEVQKRFRRDAREDTMGTTGPGKRLNRKNKRKKANRRGRGRGRRFLQMLTSGPKKNKE